MKYAYVYVLDTLSDWELGYVMPELQSGQYFKRPGQHVAIKVVSATGEPIVTKGGLTIVPDGTVEDVRADSAVALLLPGADQWHEPQHRHIVQKAKELLDKGVLVGAICGATTALAQAELLNGRPHTSNSLEYLAMSSPNYKGAKHYKDQQVVRDGNLVTASAAGSLEFAKEIIQYLDVFSDQTLTAWYAYFSTGESHYFSQILQSLPQEPAGE